MAQASASTIKQEREEMYATFQYAASFCCVVENLSLSQKKEKKWIFADKQMEAKKHQTEWCVAANKYRCMRCGRR